jgi:hypothetical protein
MIIFRCHTGVNVLSEPSWPTEPSLSVAIYLKSSLQQAPCALLPSISVITLCTIYINAGLNPTLSYVKKLLILLPPWVVYVLGLIFLLSRVGPVWALIISIAAYLLVSFIILRFFHIEL